MFSGKKSSRFSALFRWWSLLGLLKLKSSWEPEENFMLMTTHQSVHVSAFYDALVAFTSFTSRDTTKTSKIFSQNFSFTCDADVDLHFMDVFGEPKSDYRTRKKFMLIWLGRRGNLHNLMNFVDAAENRQKRNFKFVWCIWHWLLIAQSICGTFEFSSLIDSAEMSEEEICRRRFSVCRWCHRPGTEHPWIPRFSNRNKFQETALAQWRKLRDSHSKEEFSFGASLVRWRARSRWLRRTFTHL